MSDKIKQEMALTYDDVQLVPAFSQVTSRLDTFINTQLYGRNGSVLDLSIPIISAAMDTVTNGEMAKAMARLGALGIIHRFQTVQQRWEQLGMANGPVGVSVGLDDSIDCCLKLAERAVVLNVDIAHADSQKVIDFVQKLRSATNCILMVGNIATHEAAGRLVRAGADVLKVGIGGGSICSTRMVTGFGIPNITAIINVVKGAEEAFSWMEMAEKFQRGGRVTVVADGGIRYGSDVAKALAAGADAVMIGSLFAGTDEAPGQLTIGPDGHMSKKYRGMASKDAQDEWRGMKDGTAAEGITTFVRHKGSVVPIVKELAGGLRSALTYAGARNLQEFYHNTEFVQVTQAGVIEASTHILRR